VPELVANGPAIPVELMNARDSQNVVFFCGAGISMSSGLPSFGKLVEDIYQAARVEPDDVEKSALDLMQPDPRLRRPKFDKAIGLLEREHRLRPDILRKIVVERLSAPWSGALPVHRALLDLSKTSNGYRLVTTNFDQRFEVAGLEGRYIDAGPKLPVPKRHSWHSLVHLHGSIRPGESYDNLILTAADFGRAYLTERWASRFVTELFREFTVVFVGYSLDDPVMAYMVDALAAERSRGAQFGRAYAFAEHEGTEESKKNARDGWMAKNVEPILFDRSNSYSLLSNTLVSWAQITRDPFRARAKIALEAISRMPVGPHDPLVGRVCWALEDPASAFALAQSPKVTDEKDYPKIEAWIEAFDSAGLLARATRPNNGNRHPAPLVDNGYRTSNPPELDKVTIGIGAWIAKHIHVPQVLRWVISKGGHLHPLLKDEIRRQLASPDINSQLRFFWTILVESTLQLHTDSLWLPDQLAHSKQPIERHVLEKKAIQAVTPVLILKPGPSDTFRIRKLYGGGKKRSYRLEAPAHAELSIGDEHHHYNIGRIFSDKKILARYANEMTAHLEQALTLLSATDTIKLSAVYRPAIADSSQNDHRCEWGALIDWVRDSYAPLATTDRKRAAILLQYWASSKHPLLRRLALHTVCEDPKANINLIHVLLLANGNSGLWDAEMRPELLRFFRLRARRLNRDLRRQIVDAIKAGPKKTGKRRNIDREMSDHMIGLRLQKLVEGGIHIDKATRALADALYPITGQRERDELLVWGEGARWIGSEERITPDLLEESTTHLIERFRNESINLDAFEGLASLKPVKALSILRGLGKQGFWPASSWQRLLWAIAARRRRKELSKRLEYFIATLLIEAPELLFSGVGSSAADFVECLAEACPVSGERYVDTLWNKAWAAAGLKPDIDHNDPLTTALNHAAGKLADAALNRLWKYSPEAGSGLPNAVRHYFDMVVADQTGHLGRVMLMPRLHQLFSIDPQWTKAHLINRLNSINETESRDLWIAYAWSPTIGPNLLVALKESFVLALQNYANFDGQIANLVALFASICLEAADGLTEDEIRSVIETLPNEALVLFLNRLADRLEAAEPERRADVWKQKIHPWLEKYWPQLAGRNTPETSLALMLLLLKTGEAFSTAVEWALINLKPIKDRGLYVMSKSGFPASHPQACLQLLKKVVSPNINSWEKSFLNEALDGMEIAAPSIVAEGAFQDLRRIANQ